MRLRVMVWNVHGFRAGVRNVGEAVRRIEPDVLVLNETRYLGVRLWRFARRVGMFGPAGTGVWRPIPNAVLSGDAWRVVRGEKLVFPRTGRTIRRGVVTATLGRAGRRIDIASVHLGLSAKERIEHARVLTDLLAGRHWVVIGGDLNEGPESAAASWIGDRYWDVCADGCGPTFPSGEPRARIDYLFVSAGIEVERAAVVRDADALSDHRPIVADLVVP
jgi:endonuclease/exonuclease/phosphatase family metal-dependent hydrolase